MRANTTYILFIVSFFCFQINTAQELDKKNSKRIKPTKSSVLNFVKDTVIDLKKDRILNKKTDSIATDSIKPKEAIDGIITHNAEGYTAHNKKTNTLTLYDKAHVTYTNIDLKAGIIIMDNTTNLVFAKGIKDSLGYNQRPVFKQDGQESEQDSIIFNFKTKKALIYGVKTVQSGIITYGEKTKRVNDSTIYMRKLRFTTSQKKNPDYYIQTSKAKLIPGKFKLSFDDISKELYLIDDEEGLGSIY